ncbi:hypothetical protein [Aestuariivivens sediminis]|uniref:hypothetical protein n=1 Tax=Aestuariivivens sediminis TaxID=2913557 RepID=UPI001F579814|nr:hypothetical protein [Aestuariivivens sediminis]
MSMNRVCPNCFRKENLRYNFGNNIEAEKKFHSEKWCECGYNSPKEMMLDQDMGFTDPDWIRIAKYFIENYHATLATHQFNSKDEVVRFFLKMLKYSANNIYKEIVLVNNDKNNHWENINYGKPKTKPKSNIFGD